ncbi:hypothetical protein [Nitrososphaeria virus YSH_922147]|uniref:Uncharacterized protein n=1 Tax=Nitrososphaeria virus YSH_922147 TaxID=3071323 RepID=A0A976UAS8_9CAUD|nr:hypothetical protein QKV94_gp54 [Yangshan Harbor Nitrososphaeria virus]UVF62463.1 hypothetical protein [Nitrososphaeria virus YSH_922147]
MIIDDIINERLNRIEAKRAKISDFNEKISSLNREISDDLIELRYFIEKKGVRPVSL